MRKIFLSFVVLLTVITVSMASSLVAGRWTGSIDGKFPVTVTIKESNGKLSGTVSSQIGEIPLSNGKINGNDISFRELSYNGIAVSSIKGKIDGDRMDVTVNFQGQDLQGTLSRIK